MWISKKKWKELFDEQFKLRNNIDLYEAIEDALKKMEENNSSYICYLGKTGMLVSWSCYQELLSRADNAEHDYYKTKQELDHYKQLYLDELQKRLELADRVRELEGK